MFLQSSRTRAGFTLVELAGVIVVLAALSFTAFPALSGIERAEAAGDRSHVETLVVLARERAWASGRAHALRFSPATGEVSVIELPAFDGAPVAIASINGAGKTARLLSGDAIAGITGVTAGGGGAYELWFSGSGEPLESQPGDETGVPLTEVAEVRFESGAILTVTQRSGAVAW